MASRSLTDVFLLMRNNAVRSRHIYPDQDNSERMHLVSLNDMEEGLGDRNDNRMPPMWIDYLEKAQMILPKLKAKINELKMLHSRLLNRPTFDESPTDEIVIENCTQEITRMFNETHRLVQIIKSHSSEGPMKEQRLTINVYHSLASALQELSTMFRSTQNNYLRQIQSREDRAKIYFDNQLEDEDLYNREADDIDTYFVNSKQMSQQQLLLLEEENTRFAQEREQEVNAIVKSIVDLNEIFKDLSQMVADQGTVLDRIDYNVEQTQIQVYEGFKQLQKADAYQRKNRKMCAILVLAVTTIILFFTLIIVKS
ncbi:Syntaxin-16-like Protein [Tribolium castaneum]|uniref:Syntaxin-16-like Protein n=1 Tax=Tribolium castaneum TaxID=7070 RepID=D6WQ45_TRICA|nr:PREDICTED: syntaxin-16 [Tribolium castaneum]EFA06921.2 Syntaxin-16-like Protein [Tribolium castaneum]|eukprot:XP_008195725.1 PREDICTED: syntaxin-16 [Tribolium castaneum]